MTDCSGALLKGEKQIVGLYFISLKMFRKQERGVNSEQLTTTDMDVDQKNNNN